MSLAQTRPTISTWQIDPAHTHIGFAVRHLMIATVKGRFGAFDGTLRLDEEDITRSSVEVTIDVASIDTRNEQRDAHLRSADFFDAENHPYMTYVSRGVEVVGEGELRVTGDLTIRGTTREVVLDVTRSGRNRSPWGDEVIAFAAEGTIDREAFGLTWNQALETGGLMVGKDVRLSLEVEAIGQ